VTSPKNANGFGAQFPSQALLKQTLPLYLWTNQLEHPELVFFASRGPTCIPGFGYQNTAQSWWNIFPETLGT
jgi:hypothetical protein